MGRPAKFSEDLLLDAALAVVAREGKGVTASAIAAEAGAQPGSLYYRFPNREVLLLALWVRSIERFQGAFLAAARAHADPGEALVAAAVTIPRHCRVHPQEARAMTLFRHEGVVCRLESGHDELAACPGKLRDAVRILNDEVQATVEELTRCRFGSLEALALVRMAVQQTPYGLVRPFIGAGAEPMPVWLDDMVAVMVSSALALGDRSSARSCHSFL